MGITWGPRLIKELPSTSDGKTTIVRHYQTKAATAQEAHTAALGMAKPTGYVIESANTDYASDDSRSIYATQVTYGTPQGGNPESQAENPLDRPATVSYQMETVEEPFFRDVNGKMVVNSAKQTFETMPTRQRSRMIINVTVNVDATAFSPTSLRQLVDTYNSGAVTIDGVSYAAKTLLFSAPTASEQFETSAGGTSYHYYAVSYSLKLAPDGETWDKLKVLDAGYHELVSGKWKPIADENGNDITKPWPLNGSGTKIDNPSDANAVYLEFQPYLPHAWTGIDFD